MNDPTSMSATAHRHDVLDHADMGIVGRLQAAAVPNRSKITIKNLSFFYGETEALKNVSLDLPEKQVTAIIGPSGCGKSTLLRVLNRLYDMYPDQRATGEVLLDGQDILGPDVDLNLLRSRIGMVFQVPTPFPMSIFDNIATGIQLYEHLPKAELADRVEIALSRAALWSEVKDKLDDSGISLSVGQQQRLCLARTIAFEPEVILFDEPCSALDPISTAHIEALIGALQTTHTIVIVTHNIEQAARVSDFAAFMYLGEMIESGSTAQVFASPREARTQEYMRGRFG